MDKAFVRRAVFGAFVVLAGLSPDHAFTQAPFYQGKTITINFSGLGGAILY